MNSIAMSDLAPELSRARRLKAATAHAHDRLDSSIMAAEPFADRARYARFVQIQYLFHRDIAALYTQPTLSALLPDLPARRRLELIAQDLADLGQAPPAADGDPVFVGEQADLPTALGWLYVAEGSTLGAAFLLKAAAKLGLSETCGARHLAGAPEGRGLHWRNFTTALDSIDLSPDQEAQTIVGAQAAFARVQALVQHRLPGS